MKLKKIEEDWKKRFRERFRKKTFSPRIIRDLKMFDPPDVVESLVDKMNQVEGKGLYICGPTGSGKTILAAMILEAFRLKHYVQIVSLKEGYESKEGFWAYFVCVCDLLAELRNIYSEHKSEKDVVEKYSVADYLVLDDIGAEKVSDWAFQVLYLIINRRYEYLKPTIFTSNFNLDSLADKLGDDRIPSRIFDMCYIHTMESLDRRALNG